MKDNAITKPISNTVLRKLKKVFMGELSRLENDFEGEQKKLKKIQEGQIHIFFYFIFLCIFG